MFHLANLKLNIIEFGGSVVILAVAIALMAVVEDIAGSWSNIAFIAIIVAFSAAMCLFGWRLAPYLYDHYS